MKVTVSQQQLAHGLSTVSRAVSPRSTLPVLATSCWPPMKAACAFPPPTSNWASPAGLARRSRKRAPSPSLPAPSPTWSAPCPMINVTSDIESHKPRVSMCAAAPPTPTSKASMPRNFRPCRCLTWTQGVELNVADFREMIQQVAFAPPPMMPARCCRACC